MGQPAAVQMDKIVGQCPLHTFPNPSSGLPQPGPPLPFSAPLIEGVAPTVLIGGLPAAVLGSAGINTPPHVGLHPQDPAFLPLAQRGTVVSGSGTVLIEGKPAARTGDSATICNAMSAQVIGTAATVLIGG